MSVQLDARTESNGTRFKLYAQSPALLAYEPEPVWVSAPPGSLRPGPSDERMRVVDAIGKRPYDNDTRPPWSGAFHPPAQPDASGNFAHFPVDSREFNAAHMFGALRRVLDIWEDYFADQIDLSATAPTRGMPIELIPFLEWDNAQTGPGFLETGYGLDAAGRQQPFCLNLDILAHELGHRILFDKVGVPFDTALTAEYLAFQESAADLVALVSALHFNSVVTNVLDGSAGNLYVLNELNRIGEISDCEEIRIASNMKRMVDVVDVTTPPERLTSSERHEISEPLTGALFDVFVDMFQDELVARGLIAQELANRTLRVPNLPVDHDKIQGDFDRAYAGNEQGFKDALLEARDALAKRLVAAWRQLSPNYLTFGDVAGAYFIADRRLSGWRYQDDIRDNFAWRGIRAGRGIARRASIIGGAARSSALFSLVRPVCNRTRTAWRRPRRQSAT